MLSYVVLVAVCFIAYLKIDKKSHYNNKEIGAVIFFVIPLLIVFMVSGIFQSNNQLSKVKESSVDIVSLTDGQGIEGHFFLGTGWVGDKAYIYYRVQRTDGGKYQHQLDFNERVGIYEGEYVPHLEVWVDKYPGVMDWFLFKLNDNKEYRFFVPPHTTKDEFKIN